MTDHALLQTYAAQGASAQAAFGELVSRHLNLVYSAARRQVPHLADDIAQSVFLDLARHASTFPSDQPLAPWLHVVTRRTAVDTIRREFRRAARETAAAQLAATAAMPPSSSSPWSAIAPHVDEAVAALPDPDRTAIILRFFENKNFRDIGAALGLSDDAAQKRVSRALDQLRTLLTRRGLTVTAAGLALDLSAHATLTAPAALGPLISGTLASATATATTGAVALSSLPTVLTAAAAAALLVLAVYSVAPRVPADAPPQAVARTSAATRNSPPTTTSLPAAAPVISPLTPDQRIALLQRLLGELPAQNLPEIKLLAASDWTEVVRKHELDTPADIRVAFADLRAIARKKFAAALQGAVQRFTAATAGQLPTQIEELLPFLTAPADRTMLARYTLLRSGKLGEPTERLFRERPDSDMILSVSPDDWSITNNPAIPAAFGETDIDTVERTWRALGTALGGDTQKRMAALPSPRVMSELMAHTINAVAPIFGGEEAFGEAMKAAAMSYRAHHSGETPSHFGQILPYLPNAEKFVAAVRPAFAQLDFLRENAGRQPTSPAELRPYLDRAFVAAEALSIVKLTWDGTRLTTDVSWGTK